MHNVIAPHKFVKYYITIAALGFILHLLFLQDIVYPTTDDIAEQMKAAMFLNHHFQELWNGLKQSAVHQGRFAFPYALMYVILPGLIKNIFIKSILYSATYIATGYAVSRIIFRSFLNESYSLLFFLLYIFVLPIYGGWYGYYHFNLLWKIPIIIFYFSQVVLTNYESSTKKIRPLILLSYWILLFLAISPWEQFFFVFSFLVGMRALHELDFHNGISGLWSGMKKQIVMHAPPIVSYGLLSVAFIHAFPSSRIASMSRINLDIVPVAETIFRFLISGQPINKMSLDLISTFIHQSPLVFHTIGLNWAWAMVLLIGGLLASFLWKMMCDTSFNDVPQGKRYSTAQTILILFGVAIISCLLYSITSRYQNWLKLYSPWYTPSYHVGICLMAIGGVILDKIYTAVRQKSPIAKRAFITALTLAILLCNIPRFSSWLLTAKNFYGWTLVSQLSRSDVTFLKDGSTVIAPEFVKRGYLDGTTIASAFFGKKVNIVDNYDFNQRPTKQNQFNRVGGNFFSLRQIKQRQSLYTNDYLQLCKVTGTVGSGDQMRPTTNSCILFSLDTFNFGRRHFRGQELGSAHRSDKVLKSIFGKNIIRLKSNKQVFIDSIER